MKKIFFILFILFSVSGYSQSWGTSYLKYGNSTTNYCYNYPIYDVYILAGQSNAFGSGNGANVIFDQTYRNYANLYTRDTKYLKQFKTGTSYACCPTNVSVGVEFPLGKLLADTTPVIFIKYAIVGTPIYADGTTQNWNIYSIGGLYFNLLATVDSFKTYMTLNDYHYNFKGVIWFQGESDADGGVRQAAYQTNMSDWIFDIRQYLNISDLPIYNILIHDDTANKQAINTAKQASAASLSNVFCINTHYMDWKSDSVHMADNGLKVLADSLLIRIRNVNY